MPLSDIQCRKAAAKATAYKLTDSGGLHLYVRPSGHKAWRYRYRIDGSEKLLTIGPYPEVSLVEAREARDSARRILRSGGDPSVERKQRRAARAMASAATFRSVAEEWHATYQAGWNDRYAQQILDRMRNHLFPRFGSVPIASVTAAMVLQAIREVESTGAFEMAHRVRQHASDVFLHGIATGRCQDDPAHVIAKALKPVPKRLQPAVVTIDEARAVLRQTEVQGAHKVTKLASRLLALTAARSGVLRLAEPHEFEGLDGNEPIWRIPAAKMKLKPGRKANAAYEFVIPLARQSVEIVRAAITLAGPHSKYIFRSQQSGAKPISNSTLGQMYLDAGLRGRHVPHGWRASFSTIMNERAAREDRAGDRIVIDLMLAHVQDGVEPAYNRALYMPRRRELAQIWADLLMDGMPPVSALVGTP